MKNIEVVVFEKYPVYVERDKIYDAHQGYVLTIRNLTAQQKDEILKLLDTMGEIVTNVKLIKQEKELCQYTSMT